MSTPHAPTYIRNLSNCTRIRVQNTGYMYAKIVGHPRANKEGMVPTSVLVVEHALGKYLPLKAVVHHIDGNRRNNTRSNLVACEDKAYNELLHARERALHSCGNANWRKCTLCKRYDDVSNMDARFTAYNKFGNTYQYRHIECHKDYMRKYNAKLRSK